MIARQIGTTHRVTVASPDLIWLWNNGITEPEEPSTLPKRSACLRVSRNRQCCAAPWVPKSLVVLPAEITSES